MVACAHTYASEPIHEGTARLSPRDSIYVGVPEAGSHANQVYDASGRQTAEAVAEAFRRHVERIEIAPGPQSHEETLGAARTAGFDRVVEIFIDHWEDRMTEWSGKSDRISIRIAVYRAADGELLDAVRMNGKSRWGTLGGDHPQDLLAVPVSEYVDSLF